MSQNADNYEDYADFGNIVAMLRTRARFSQQQLARLVGVSDVTIRHWETGSKPDPKNLERLLHILLDHDILTKGKELNEAKLLWIRANLNAAFDEAKFNQWLSEKQNSVTRKTNTALNQQPDFLDIDLLVSKGSLGANSSEQLSLKSPITYIPFARDPLFQSRPNEFERLEAFLCDPAMAYKSIRLGLIGVTGIAGVGKTALAIELAYRLLDQQLFPGGIFWMSVKGTDFAEWQRQLARLAFNTNYLPPKHDISHSENEARRAQHLCRYLAHHSDALLILDNIQYPDTIIEVLAGLAGGEMKCSILYTSRITQALAGITTYSVESLPEDAALRLLLETTRPTLLSRIETASTEDEAVAARLVCERVGYLPLALVHLRGQLTLDNQVPLTLLAELLVQHGTLDIIETLFSTFALSWEKVQNKDARRLFLLATYFPEATTIPLWLLGLATGLGERSTVFDPLGKAYLELQKLSFFITLSGNQVRIHPLVCEFGQRLVIGLDDQGKTLREEAVKRIIVAFDDLTTLEQRAKSEGYWRCLEQIQAVRIYTRLLGSDQTEQLERWERWMERDSYLLGNERWWPKTIPGLFYQQLFNRSVEEGYPMKVREASGPWLRQLNQVGEDEFSFQRVLAGHTGAILSMSFSPDGRLILTGSSDRSMRLWETNSGELLRVIHGHTDQIWKVAFSPDGKWILSGSSKGDVCLWETSSGKSLRIFEGHKYGIIDIGFSPDGRQILAGSFDGKISFWESFSGKLLKTFQVDDSLACVAFSPDRKVILASTRHYIVLLWDLPRGQVSYPSVSQLRNVMCVEFSPDGRQAIAGSLNGDVWLWEIASDKLLRRIQGHKNIVKDVTFSRDGKHILSDSTDGEVRLWESTSGSLLAIFSDKSDDISSTAYSPDGKHILLGASDGKAWLWKIKAPESLPPAENSYNPVTSVALSSDGQQVFVSHQDGKMQLWETTSGKLLRTIKPSVNKSDPQNQIASVTFSQDNQQLLTVSSEERGAQLWDMASGKLLRTFRAFRGSPVSIGFSSNGQTILACYPNGDIEVWEIAIGQLLRTVRLYLGKAKVGKITSAVFSSDSQQLVIGTVDGQVRLWEATSGRLLATFTDHTDRVTHTIFSSDSQQLLTSSTDGQVRLWEATSGRLLEKGHLTDLTGVAFSPNGHYLLTCDKHRRALLWRVSGSTVGRLLGVYITFHEVRAVYWQDPIHILLVDIGGLSGRLHFYRLKIEGVE